MKTSALCLILSFFMTPALAQEDVSDLAEYRFKMEITGMNVEGFPPGAWDRDLGFSLQFPADDLELGTRIWYDHMQLCFGQEVRKKLQRLQDQP